MRDTIISWLFLLGGGVSAWALMQHYRKRPDDNQAAAAPVSYIPPTFSNAWTPPPKAAPYLFAFDQAERANGLPKNLLARMAQQESNYNPAARGASGEIGIMQIIPRWHPDANAADPFASIAYAGRWLRSLYDRFGTWEKAIAAYNWGPTALATYGLQNAPTTTRRYIAAISADVLLI